MTKLLIKQRVFSWGDKYDVYDRDGKPKYYVESELFTFGHKIHIYDYKTNREVAYISERVFTFLQRAEITVGGIPLGEITKEFTFFVPKYSIDYNGWTIDGDFMEWDYSIYDRNNSEIATISKELFRWGDTYSLTVENDSDEVTALVTVIAIDMMICSRD